MLDGVELTSLTGEEMRRRRPGLQIILQDSISSLNPRRKVFHLVARGLRIWKSVPADEVRAKVDEMLEAVGLDPDTVRDRRPHQFSGGQCQRICIARSLIVDPKVLICDEPVSALDVSVQAQILNLLEAMKQRYGLTLVFISHDLGVVKNVSDRVAVMYLGKLCEVGGTEAVYAHAAHHYTNLLIESIPDPSRTGARCPRRTRVRSNSRRRSLHRRAVVSARGARRPPSAARWRSRSSRRSATTTSSPAITLASCRTLLAELGFSSPRELRVDAW